MKQFRRQQTAARLLDGKVLVAGGAPFAQAATSELYNPVTASWTNSSPLATGLEFHTAMNLVPILVLDSFVCLDVSRGHWAP
jgi:hypothetical protein